MASASQLLHIYYNLEHTWDANVYKAICEYRFSVSVEPKQVISLWEIKF